MSQDSSVSTSSDVRDDDVHQGDPPMLGLTSSQLRYAAHSIGKERERGGTHELIRKPRAAGALLHVGDRPNLTRKRRECDGSTTI